MYILRKGKSYIFTHTYIRMYVQCVYTDAILRHMYLRTYVGMPVKYIRILCILYVPFHGL